MTSEVEYFRSGTTFQEFCREFFADKPEALETDEARTFMGAVDRIALYGGECWMRPGNLDDRFVFAALDWFALNSSPLLDEIAQILSTDSSARLVKASEAIPFADKRCAFIKKERELRVDRSFNGGWVDEMFVNQDFLRSFGGICRLFAVRKLGDKRRILHVDF